MGRNKKSAKVKGRAPTDASDSSDSEEHHDAAAAAAESGESSDEEQHVKFEEEKKKKKPIPKKAQQLAEKAEKASASTAESGPVTVSKRDAVKVTYCPQCTLPVEFCQYSGMFETCKPWLIQNLPADEAAKYIDAEERGRKQKAGGAPSGGKKAKVKEVTIQINKRAKHKFTTIVRGLDAFGHDLKAIAADWKKRFSCGTAVESSPGTPDGIEVQGDVADAVIDLLQAQYDVPADAIFTVEKDKKTPIAA